jgi:hypothetical protein
MDDCLLRGAGRQVDLDLRPHLPNARGDLRREVSNWTAGQHERLSITDRRLHSSE